MNNKHDVVTSVDMHNLTREIGQWLNMNHNSFNHVEIHTNYKDGLYIASIEYYKNGGEIDE